MKENNYTIGVLGGMGTYATIHAFRQYAEVFPAEKEWDRPRLIIDNRCTMPSRVRAFLYNENVEKLVHEMTDSITHLMSMGCDRILLACNTSHLFLPEIYKIIPEAEKRVVNIIESCVNKIREDKVKKVYLLATEGTIESRVYQSSLEKYGIQVVAPHVKEYALIRECIEGVKQNKYTEDLKMIFYDLINRSDTYILGCTELPVLYEKYSGENLNCKKIYDPIYLSLLTIKEEFDK